MPADPVRSLAAALADAAGAELVLERPGEPEHGDYATNVALQLAEIEVHRTTPNAGRTIRDLRVRHETGAIIIALRKADGTFDTTPEPDEVLHPGDVLIGVGTPEELRKLEDMFSRRETVAG